MKKRTLQFYFNYIPCLIMLIFGMVALNSSLLLTNKNEDVLYYYKETAHDILDLEKELRLLNDTASLYFLKPDLAGKLNIQQNLKRFKETYKRKIQKFKSIDEEVGLYNQTDVLLTLSEELNAIEDLFSNSETSSGALNEQDFSQVLFLLNKKIEFLWEALYTEAGVQKALQEIDIRERWLYWSILLMAFSGFMLIVLNADKLRKLKAMNTEKRKSVILLENRLAAMEATLDGIAIADHGGNLTYMNQAVMDILSIDSKKEECLGRPWLELFPESVRDKIEEECLADFFEEGYSEGAFPLIFPDGNCLHVEIALTELPDGGFIGTLHDVTDKCMADAEKERLQGQFYQAQKMEAVGRLAGGIAHDFNNILAAMNGYAEFLIEDLENDTQPHKFAENILAAGRQAREVVDQMLAFSRQSESDILQLDLIVPVQETLSMLTATLPKTVEVVTDIQLENAPVYGNSTQIAQVIMNLCLNANDAMEGRHGRLEITLQEINPEELQIAGFLSDDLPEKGNSPQILIEDMGVGGTRLTLNTLARKQKYVCLSVRDTGSGMGRVIMEHIFEPFFTTKSVDKGTGLGMATVHGVVAGHQGAMIVESVLEEGTIFKLFFPMSDSAEISGFISDNIVQGSGTGRILLVEDQEVVRDMMIRMLERIGFEPSYCTTGLEALNLLKEDPKAFDLVITDQNMPEMTGLELVQQISVEHPDLPFILLSGYSLQKIQDLIKDHPSIKAILRKPVLRSVLSRKIASVLAVSKAKKIRHVA